MAEPLQRSTEGMRQRLWGWLTRHYPVLVAWWQERQDVPMWPTWDKSRHQAMLQEALGLAELSTTVDDAEMLQWGRFLRSHIGRLREEVWRRPSLPLEYGILTLRLTQIQVGRGAPSQLAVDRLEEAASWLSQESTWGDLLRGTAIDDAALLVAQLRIADLIRSWPRPAGCPSPAWAHATDALKSAVRDFVLRNKALPTAYLPEAAWLPVGALNVTLWQEMRHRLVSGKTGALLPPPPKGPVLLPPGTGQRSLASLRSTAWVHPVAGECTVFYGTDVDPKPALTWAAWQRGTKWSSLSWCLANSPVLEGRLGAVLDTRQETVGHLARFRVSAAADAWLWLEDGDVSEAAAWLSQQIGQPVGEALVLDLKCQPGYALARYFGYVLARQEMAEDALRFVASGPLDSWPKVWDLTLPEWAI